METYLIKIGGAPAENEALMSRLAAEIKELQTAGERRFVLVHGGGPAVSAIQKQYGLEPVFIEGKRQTSAPEMDLVDMGLSGKVNTALVRLFCREGLKAVGLSGADAGSFLSEAADLQVPGENRTGRIKRSDTALLSLLLREGYFPILCPVSSDESGRGMNINADEAALAAAESLGAAGLVFLSDIPGILIEGELREELTEEEIEAHIRGGEIKGGMIPKVRSSLAALRKGVDRIHITDYAQTGDLDALLRGRKGSRITL